MTNSIVCQFIQDFVVMVTNKIYKYYTVKQLLLTVLYLLVDGLITLAVVFGWDKLSSHFSPIKTSEVPLPWIISFVFVILMIPIVLLIICELPRYLFVKDLIIEYDTENRNVTYFYGDNYINFSFSDIALFEVYRTVKDEGYIGYVVILKNGTRLRFTNRLDGIEELQKDIEASGVKNKDRTWFDNKHLPENIYI